MRATELSIVFEDDEHHEHVQRYEGDDADLLASILRIATISDVRPTLDGPVLRKVTEVVGRLYADGLPYLHVDGMPEGSDTWCISSIAPDATFHPDDDERLSYRFRFVVEAVQVTKGEKS